MSVNNAILLSPITSSHLHVSIYPSNPVKGERLGKSNTLRESPITSGFLVLKASTNTISASELGALGTWKRIHSDAVWKIFSITAHM